MDIFEKAFSRTRTSNTKKRTFANLSRGLGTNYLIFYQSAINAYNDNDLNTAFQNINKTIEKSDISDWKQYAFRANVLEDLGRYSDANIDYERAIEYAENDMNVYALYHQMGFCYFSDGNDEKAIEFYSYAIDLKNDHPNSEHNLDQEGINMGVLLGVPFKRMYNNRANAFMNIGELDKGFDDCKKSLSFDQTYSNPYLLLSQIYSKAGQEDKALEFLKISAELGNKRATSTLRKMGY